MIVKPRNESGFAPSDSRTCDSPLGNKRLGWELLAVLFANPAYASFQQDLEQNGAVTSIFLVKERQNPAYPHGLLLGRNVGIW